MRYKFECYRSGSLPDDGYYKWIIVTFKTQDDILNELENDEIPAHIREARLNDIVMRAREQQFIQQNKNDIYK